MKSNNHDGIFERKFEDIFEDCLIWMSRISNKCGRNNFATEFLWLESLKFTVLCVDEYRYLYLQYPGRARNHSLSFQQEMEMSKSCLFLFVS